MSEERIAGRPHVDDELDPPMDPVVPGLDPRANEGDSTDTPVAVGDSLADRVAARRTELENAKTEVFEVPGWNDILGVRLRMLGFQESRQIARGNGRINPETLRELYVICDLLIAATEGLVEILLDGSYKETSHNWVSLANELITRGAIDYDMSIQLTPRRAMLAIIGDARMPLLWQMWQLWANDGRREVDTEVVRDLGVTG